MFNKIKNLIRNKRVEKRHDINAKTRSRNTENFLTYSSVITSGVHNPLEGEFFGIITSAYNADIEIGTTAGRLYIKENKKVVKTLSDDEMDYLEAQFKKRVSFLTELVPNKIPLSKDAKKVLNIMRKGLHKPGSIDYGTIHYKDFEIYTEWGFLCILKGGHSFKVDLTKEETDFLFRQYSKREVFWVVNKNPSTLTLGDISCLWSDLSH